MVMVEIIVIKTESNANQKHRWVHIQTHPGQLLCRILTTFVLSPALHPNIPFLSTGLFNALVFLRAINIDKSEDVVNVKGISNGCRGGQIGHDLDQGRDCPSNAIAVAKGS